MNSRALGRVIAVHAPVVDVRRAAAALPAVDEAIAIAAWNLDRLLIAEVQQHLDPTTVRAVALENAAGLKRGASAGPWARESACWSERRFFGPFALFE